MEQPTKPGVYLFKDANQTVIYVGKAKNLKKRVASYFSRSQTDVKAKAIVASSANVDHIVTKNEVEAMLLEAELIRNYQPQFNVLLKTGQPYLYLLFSQDKLPELKIVRNKKSKGSYFGPFLEKSHARRVYNFLTKTFRLKLCKKNIANGCLYFHLGTCAGSCRDDFDKENYLARLELAKQSLAKGHKNFLLYLKDQIYRYNKTLHFEKSKEFHGYYQAFEKVFSSIQTHFSSKEKAFAHKHIWIRLPDTNTLFLFDEQNNVTKKKFALYNPFISIETYYHTHDCPQLILTNFPLENSETLEQFLQKWHKKSYPIDIVTQPSDGHLANLVSLATTHAQQEIRKQKELGPELQKLLKLLQVPLTIDCFDVSHKQGQQMVGSCIRFTNGKPEKDKFRKFKIKTIGQQNDYACLQEIVSRRYRDPNELPDLIMVDGGKGQLNAIQKILPHAQIISLAKKEETIFSKNLPEGKKLNLSSFAGQTLIALRDYAHHFAISYHRSTSSRLLQAS